MNISIRQMTNSDRATWIRMRAALWPEETPQGHAEWTATILAAGDYWAFIAEADGAPAGFAEVAVRKYANGCESAPVPFLEGIWVEPQFRRQGVGRRLIIHVEEFLTSRGFRELGSDTQLENLESQAAHVGWGFAETERVVYFRKPLHAH